MVNDYDHYAAERQADLKKGGKFSHHFVEKPAMRELLPDLTGKRVLMLGCGTGEESMLLEEFGARAMTGVDLSKESVKLANDSYPTHDFVVGDMHQLNFADACFDFVYSSLTIHYSAQPIDVYREIFRVLKPGGRLQFSVGHPMRWASERVELDGTSTKLMGYTEGDALPRLYGNYADFRQYQETFPSGEVLEFWIGPPSLHFTLLSEAGFQVKHFVETKAIPECEEVNPAYYQRFSTFPQFAIFTAEKPTTPEVQPD